MNSQRDTALSAPLQLDGVTVDISGRRIVEQIELCAEGNIVGLVGPNGSGKSTVLRTVYRVLRPTAGSVTADGRNVWSVSARQSAQTIAAVAQDSPTSLDLTVAEYVTTGRVPHHRLLGGDSAADNRAIDLAVHSTGIGELINRQVNTLSGGERQRVHLARALAQQPRILVLDEPTNHLDIRHQLELLTLVQSLKVTTLITLHDLNLAAAYCDRIIVLSHGSVVGAGVPLDVLTPPLLRDVFGINAVCSANPLTGRLSLVFSPASA